MSKRLIPRWVKRWHAWLGFVVVLGGATAVLTAAIPEFPRWTWFSEHKALVVVHETDTILLAGKIKSNTISILEESVSFLRRERRALRAEDRALKRKGDHDPKIQQELDEIEDQLRDAESKLKAKRGH